MGERATKVARGASVDLLEALAFYERYREQRESEIRTDVDVGVVNIRTGKPPMVGLYPTHVPLFAAEWKYADSTMLRAARECSKMGWIELHDTEAGWMVRITPAGMARAPMPQAAPAAQQPEPETGSARAPAPPERTNG